MSLTAAVENVLSRRLDRAGRLDPEGIAADERWLHAHPAPRHSVRLHRPTQHTQADATQRKFREGGTTFMYALATPSRSRCSPRSCACAAYLRSRNEMITG